MARLIKDPVGNERLISWMRVMLPEARAKSVLRPERPGSPILSRQEKDKKDSKIFKLINGPRF